MDWFDTAKSLLGTKETPGNADNPRIIAWANEIGGWIAKAYTDDSIPWCGLFVGYCLKKNNIAVGNGILSALSWASWGVPLSKGTPGAIMVFIRPGGGHVGFYVSEDKDTYHILGGNQSDNVTVTRIQKGRLKAIRWPKERPVPTTGPVFAKFTGSISQNEA